MESPEKSSHVDRQTGRPPWLDPDQLKLTKKQQPIFTELLKWLQKREGQLAAGLLGSRVPIANPDYEMRSLVNLLIEEFPQEETDAALTILSRLVHQRNETKTTIKIRLPEFSAKIPPVANPFTLERWGGLSNVRIWRGLLVEEITNSLQTTLETQELAYGRVLASAVLFGGLVSRQVLAALYNILPQWAAHTSLSHGRLAVTWTERGNHRRWLPDALTALLLLRLPSSPTPTPILGQTERQRYRAINSAMERALSGYFKSASKIREQRPANLSGFLDAALFDLELRLPRALAQYAASKQVSHSLRPKAWRRLMGEPPIKDELPPAQGREAFMTGEPANDELPNNDGESEQEGDFDNWLKDLRNMLNPNSKRDEKGAALKSLRIYLEKPSSPVSQILPAMLCGFLNSTPSPGKAIPSKLCGRKLSQLPPDSQDLFGFTILLR